MTNESSIINIQKIIDSWIKNHGDYWSPLSMMCAIVEEVGEVAREINNLEGYKPKMKDEKVNLSEELGDLLFSIICLANYYDIKLNDAISKSIEKFSERDANRFIK